MNKLVLIYFVFFTLAVLFVMFLATSPLIGESPVAHCVGKTEGDEYHACRADVAKRFIEIEYPEVKDLSKMFFTLVSAIFVASLAFWEKILVKPGANSPARYILAAAWVSLLISLISCGIGLALSAVAFDLAAWEPRIHFDKFATSSLLWLMLSGGLFVWGLILFTVTSIWSVFHQQEAA